MGHGTFGVTDGDAGLLLGSWGYGMGFSTNWVLVSPKHIHLGLTLRHGWAQGCVGCHFHTGSELEITLSRFFLPFRESIAMP